MPGISSVFNIAKGALLTHQTAMNVTGNNIANVNTPGYSRQKAKLGSNISVGSSTIHLGMGVKIDSVVQQVDQFVNRSIFKKLSSLDEFTSRASVLRHLESIFNETLDQGLARGMNDFWRAWQDTVNNPGGYAERTALLDKSDLLARRFNAMSNDLVLLRDNMNANLSVSVEELNLLTRQVAELNEKVVMAESTKTVANDLRDQRATLLEKIAGLVESVYLEDGVGSVSVLTSTGILLVDGNNYTRIGYSGGEIRLNGGIADASANFKSGKIGAWLDIRDAVVPEYLANLDELAGSLIFQINNLHRQGVGLNGETGKNFFVPNPGDDYSNQTPGASFSGAALYFALSDEVRGNPQTIAAGASTAPGDNRGAQRIASLQTDSSISIRKWTYRDRGGQPEAASFTTTFQGYYETMVGELGILARSANEGGAFQQSLLDNLSKLRDSISGVNMDEELAELLMVQRAHQAAAKLVAIADEMLQTILQIR